MGEGGTGLGPTLEFFNLVSNEIRGLGIWRGTDDHYLFPAPLEDEENLKYFEFMGAFTAKAISD
jgi:hypothetical protein